MKRYAGQFNIPYAFGMKKRDWATGKILGLDLVNGDLVKDRDVLIIDDICSRGGTFLHSARALKEAGAKDVYLYITHAEDTMVEGEMYNDPDLVKHIYTTNSIFHKHYDALGKVTVIENW
jgi:ribose-phosphate pyrophosphokinase